MALAFSVLQYFPTRNGIRERLVDITLDTDYPSGGWPVTAADFGLQGITRILPGAVGGFTFAHDAAASKILAYMGDNNNASDGPGVECTTGLNGLDTLVLPARVIGY